MSIRTATKNDLEEMKRLAFSLSHFYLNNKESKLPDWFLKMFTDEEFLYRLQSTEFANYVFEENGFILGFITIKNESQLYHLFVAEEHHRKGISRKLWEHVKKSFPVKNIFLRSSIFAIPVYQKFGFVEVGPVGEKDGIQFQLMELAR